MRQQRLYRFVAACRNLVGALTRRQTDAPHEAPTAWVARWLFLRALGLIYLIAFASFGSQVTGLIGARGILPAGEYLHWVAENDGLRAYWLVPSVFWLNASDTSLQFVCLAGVVLSAILLIGFAHRILLLALFVLYLSLVSAGQDFMAYQWDSLLLEVGFLAVFLDATSDLVVWLFRWLLFRLMFLSGALKLLSGDVTWRQLTALDFHFETQPLPTVIGWYVHQLPQGVHQLSTVMVLAVELLAPFLIFTSRHLRILAAACFVFLQTLIFLTGNYTFFNLLAVALCLFLLDDAVFCRVLPRGVVARAASSRAWQDAPVWTRRAVTTVGCAVFLLSGFQLVDVFTGRAPEPIGVVLGWLAPLHIVNTYGLFAVMTTERPEISVEGSNDGQSWVEYEFKYKPGDVRKPPPWVAPHQPRLDWQLWFAALGYATPKPWITNRLFGSNPSAAFWLSNYNVDPWFVNFLVRLLEGSPDVSALLARNPFGDSPPRYVRAVLYRYSFTDLAERSAEDAWWRRELQGSYFPALSLDAH